MFFEPRARWSAPTLITDRQDRAGIRNFFGLYQPIVSSWALFNASGPEPTLVAESLESDPPKVYDPYIWAIAQRQSSE